MILRIILTGLLLLTLSPLAAKTPASEMTLKDLHERSYQMEKDARPDQALKRSTQGYQQFLDSPLGGAMRREALRRVADLMQQQLEEDEDRMVSGEVTPEEEIIFKDASYEKVIQHYNEAVSNYPDFPGNEHIYYQLARAYEANGEPKQAIWALEQLIKNHSDSDYINEAYFRAAELSFLTQKFPQATKYYSELVRLGMENQFYRVAMYKSGWALFKNKSYKESLDQFIELLDHMTLDASLDDMLAELPQYTIGEREMIKDSLRVMSIAVTHQEEPLPYLQNYLITLSEPRPYEFMIYQALGDMYHYQELYQDAAQVFAAFAQRFNLHPQAPFFQIMAIETYRKGRFTTLQDESIRDFSNNFGYQTGFWTVDKTTRLKQQLEPYLRQYLSMLALRHHAALQKKPDEINKQQALHWYRTYLQSFTKDSEAAHINFLLAELLYETGDYKAAAVEYNKTAYDYGYHKESREAGYAAILAYDKQRAGLEGDALNVWRRQSLENALHFAKVFSDDERVPSIITKTAQDLFEVGAYDTAIKAASIILNLKGLTPQKERSAQLVIGHSYFEQGDYLRSENAYHAALNSMDKNDKDYDGTYERIAAAIYKQAEHQQKSGNLQAAIREYQRLVIITPRSKIRETTEFDMATAHLQLKQWQSAIDILVSMRNSAFGKKHAMDITQKLTVAYLETDQNQNAAAELETLALLAPSYDVQREAVWRAAELYEKEGNITATIKAFEDYVKRYPSPVDANIEARYKLAQLHQQQNNARLHIARLKDVIRHDAKALDQRTSRTKYLAGISSLALADIAYEEYKSIKLVEPIKKNLTRKKDQMQSVIKDYGKVSEYAIAELITNATFKIAEIYRDFSHALMTSERPKGLDDDELEMYDIMLEEQAFPFEEKAIELHEKNYHRINDGVFDQWVKNSLGKLGEIIPGRYDKSEKEVGYIEIFN